MERVQFQQEQMLAELKDLGEKGLFSSSEIKHILKKRTAFEMALVRRIPNKNDYLRYAAYEMGLEALRRKRAARLKIPKSPPSISDYALTRRQFHIFERALQKFKSDVSLWLQYLRLAQREGARALAGRIAARAVQLHPRTPALYVLAAAHELANGGMGAARSLLLRGLRLNANSTEMWREYVRLELGFVEAVRRRWDVLDITLDSAEGEGEGERVDRAEEQAMGDAARRAIMDGAIVRQAIDSGAKALPTIELFQSLQELIAGYPATEALRSALLDHLHERLAETLPGDASAVVLRATRALALTSAEELAGGALGQQPPEEMAAAYAQFVEEWCGKEDVDVHLKLYLVGGLHALIKRQSKSDKPPAAVLLAAHIRLLLTLADLPKPPAAPHRILRLAARYTSAAQSDARVWLARLCAESAHGTADSTSAAGASARRAVPACVEIWLWSAERCEQEGGLDALLAESMRADVAARRDVHQALLMRFVDALDALPSAAARRERVEHVARRCLPGAAVWARSFGVLAAADTGVDADEHEALLRDVYEYWRGAGDVEEATLSWARWLLERKGRGDEAMRVVARVHGAVGGAALAQRWAAVVRQRECDNQREMGDDPDETDDLNKRPIIFISPSAFRPQTFDRAADREQRQKGLAKADRL
ncbi:U3 small nucleolar RNA-associated protein 6-domain-containing protein [Lactarius akahatsu]|uniref:U3 small nucleolar RNA-associated protein 6-domain-containing protein n=1 Tax=Lactarius akahatsu TaxID=416441 RepID=A0AAD4QEH9_9AGAM|nr:U3 small nucleolar RNA-associated protein 6-domain-containing protein [Lactarius akahatsu]